MGFDARHLRDCSFLCAPRVQSLWKRSRGFALRIPAFCGPVGYSVIDFVDGGLVLQCAQVSAFSRLPAHYTRAITHSACIAGRCESEARIEPYSAGVWPGAAFLLSSAPLS